MTFPQRRNITVTERIRKYSEGYSRRGIILIEANPMSGVFRNIDPSPSDECMYPPAFGAGGGHTRWVLSKNVSLYRLLTRHGCLPVWLVADE